jgi:hypothetical protein
VLSRLWPRFAFEAFFLIAVALVAGLLDFSVAEVIVAMAIAYVLTVALELGAWYVRKRRRSDAVTPEPVEDVTDVEPSTAAVTVRPGDRPPRPEEDETWLERLAPPEIVQSDPEPEPVPARVPEPAAEAEPEPEPEQEPEPEPEPEPLPTSEPQPAEPQPAVEDDEPELEPAAVVPVLTAVPEPEPEPEPEQEPVAAAVATLPLPPTPREWNLWELERLTRDRAGEDQARDVEWGYLVVYLRDFARPDGTLPAEFDDLVRESFAEILATGAR